MLVTIRNGKQIDTHNFLYKKIRVIGSYDFGRQPEFVELVGTFCSVDSNSLIVKPVEEFKSETVDSRILVNSYRSGFYINWDEIFNIEEVKK